MQLTDMRPHQCATAKQENWPVFLPVGTIEYHGEHLPLGVDGHVVLHALAQVEKRLPCVIAPPIWYGVASYLVAGPEKGTIDVSADHLEKHVYDIMKALLENGYKNVIAIIHHQYANGRLMPTTLACKKAAIMAMMEVLERERGRGWWGDAAMSKYYSVLETGANPFNAIRVVPLMSPEVQSVMGYDHAGKLETSLMMAAFPQWVETARLENDGLWFTDAAVDASAELGRKAFDLIVDDLIRLSTP
jgi:creatinine amidohydrolase/Fe(II)-dependent formamide hydrolase-like protein